VYGQLLGRCHRINVQRRANWRKMERHMMWMKLVYFRMQATKPAPRRAKEETQRNYEFLRRTYYIKKGYVKSH